MLHLIIKFVFLIGTCSAQDFSYNIAGINGKVFQHRTQDFFIGDYKNLQHQLQPFELAKLLREVPPGASLKCYGALLKLFAPVLNITHWTPAAALSLLGKPVGKGILLFLFTVTYIFEFHRSKYLAVKNILFGERKSIFALLSIELFFKIHYDLTTVCNFD